VKAVAFIIMFISLLLRQFIRLYRAKPVELCTVITLSDSHHEPTTL